MKFIKKYWFILLIILISIIRFLLSFNLPSYYFSILRFDDKLMINQMFSLIKGEYLGFYSSETLIKGMIFPIVLYYARLLHLSYSTFLTILYILSSVYFLNALKKLIKNKILLLIIFIAIMFNPISYSAEAFQRLYLNSISVIELLIILGSIINVLVSKKNNIIYFIILGTISCLMLLSRNDNIWIYLILFIILIYKFIKNKNIKTILVCIIPFVIIILGFNVVSMINYKYYGVYTYNELENSYFRDAYNKIRMIEDKNNDVAITKNMLYKVSDNCRSFGLSKDEIDEFYKSTDVNKSGEIRNDSILWLFRVFIYNRIKFKNGKEANNYFKKLSIELDKAFESGKFKKESSYSSVYINRSNNIKDIPKGIINAIWYTSSYKNIRVYSKENLMKVKKTTYHSNHKAYDVKYTNYLHTDNMIKNNVLLYEIIRIIYMIFTIICFPISLIIYFKNIKKKDELNIFLHIILIVYLLIIGGVVYTHVTAFHSIIYRYLANVYILQSLFILLNLTRLVNRKRSLHNKK